MSSAGLPVAISKMVGERFAMRRYSDAHGVFRVSLFIGVVLGVASCVIMIFGAKWFVNLIKSPRSYLTLITLGPTVVIVAVMACFRGYFQGMGNAAPTAVSQLVEQIFNAFFSVALARILISSGVEKAAAGATAATGIGALAGLLCISLVYSSAEPRLRALRRKDAARGSSIGERHEKLARELLFTAGPIILGAAIFSMTNIEDMLMVKNVLIFSGYSEERAEAAYGMLGGKYNVITTLPTSISSAFATAAIPAIAAATARGDKAGAESKMNSAMRITMLISIPAAMGIGVLGDPIVKLLFPTSPDGGALLTVGSVSVAFLALKQITAGMLQSVGEVKLPAASAAAGALVKIPISYFLMLVPELGATGAVLGTTACYIVSSIIDVNYLVKRRKFKMDFMGVLIKPALASVIMGCACYALYHGVYYLTGSNTSSVFAAVAISLFTYFVILLALNGIESEDLRLLPYGEKLLKLLDKLS